MHLVPAPAVKLMKSRVLSRPGVKSKKKLLPNDEDVPIPKAVYLQVPRSNARAVIKRKGKSQTGNRMDNKEESRNPSVYSRYLIK